MRDLYAQEYGVSRDDMKYLQVFSQRLSDPLPLNATEQRYAAARIHFIIETASNVSGLAAERHAIHELCCKAEEAGTNVNPEDIRDIIMDPD